MEINGEMVKAVDDGAVIRVYKLGYEEGRKHGYEMGASTLSRNWFVGVLLLWTICAMLGGLGFGIMVGQP